MTKKTTHKPATTAPLPKYNAAGYDRTGMREVVANEEFKLRGLKRVPWTEEIKAEMVEACNGLASGADLVSRIGEIASRVA
jgi:hypothetical protein